MDIFFLKHQKHFCIGVEQINNVLIVIGEQREGDFFLTLGSRVLEKSTRLAWLLLKL